MAHETNPEEERLNQIKGLFDAYLDGGSIDLTSIHRKDPLEALRIVTDFAGVAEGLGYPLDSLDIIELLPDEEDDDGKAGDREPRNPRPSPGILVVGLEFEPPTPVDR